MKTIKMTNIRNDFTIGKHTVLKPKKVSVKTVNGRIINGSINLGVKSRVSDVFIDSQSPFVTLFDVIFPGESKKRVLILNKNHIVWIEPEDNKARPPE